ncbi:MAG: TPM domain-containing protein, partial [Bacteroidota bacterium]
MSSRVLLWCAAVLLLFVSNLSAQERAIAPHGGVWVHDEAGVLDPQTKAELEYALKAERDSTSNQIAVLLIPSLDGDDIDLYANRVFREWKLGTAEKDNGVLFLISINDRKMRIEVGLGLEGALTDAMSSRINRNEVAPYFRTGNYSEGVKAGVFAVIKAIKG